MATTTTRLSLRKPDTSDTVNVETDINDNMDTIDNNIGAEVRTSFPTSPYAGKIVSRSDQDHRTYLYTGTEWVELLIRERSMSPEIATNGDEVSTTSTSFVSVQPGVFVTFTAPASGAVYVVVTAALEAVSPDTAFASYEIRKTNVAGDVVAAAEEDKKSVIQQDAFFHMGSTRSVVTGLTPGDTYFARILCKTAAGNTARYFYRGLEVGEVVYQDA